MQRSFVFLLAVGLFPASLSAQTAQRPLTQADFDGWRSILSPALSPDGRWAAYTLTPQVGDGEVVLRATTGTTEYRFPRGYTGRPQLRANADSGFTAPAAVWTADSRHLVFSVFPTQAESERARRARNRSADQPKNGLLLVTAATGTAVSVPGVRSFRLPRHSGDWLVYQLEPDSAATVGRRDRGTGDSTVRRVIKPEPGNTIVLRDLRSQQEVQLTEVGGFAFDDSAKYLAYTVHSAEQDGNGAYLRDLATGQVTSLQTGKGSYGTPVFDRAGRQLAFVSNRTEAEREDPRFTAFLVTLGRSTPAVLAIATPDSAGEGLGVAERGGLRFVRDGSALEVPLAPVLPDTIPADSLTGKAIFDLWHWQDKTLQPQQKLQARRDRNTTYAAVYQPRLRRLVKLESADLPSVALSADGRHALGITQEPYRIEAMWGEGGSDLYAIDAESGIQTPIAKKVPFGASISPGGAYAIWFEQGEWKSHGLRTGRTLSLTGAVSGVSFTQETHDTPDEPRAWGIAGWTTGDRSVLIYDRYDIWELDPTGAHLPRMVTDSAGRHAGMVLRLVDLDRDEPFVNPAEPLLLSGFVETTKQAGFWTDRLDRAGAPRQILQTDHAYRALAKATGAETFLVTRSTFREFPNLWTGPALDQLRQISDANPQQAEIAWGNAELVSWRSDDGIPLQGILFTPPNFDPAKQYPMVVYFYEQLSNGLHNHVMTHPRNTVQPTWYSSNGYLVFFPDISYTTGYPGPDALKSIVPGVQSLVARGFVKPDAIGTAGQSWGGYQTAWMITRTNIFKAAMAGAPVANMTSAYGGIRWGSGLARSFQYEKSQSRIGGSLWEYPLRYLENSPLFAADRIETPLLMMHNDDDGAVPWYQGIEMFVALRRLRKEVYLVVYNGDDHNPTKRANQADIARRTMEFFDHHLRGAPKPDWMVKGIPYLEKGRDQLAPVITDQRGLRP